MTIDEAIAKEEKYIAVNKAKYEFECRYYGKDTVERGPKLDCVNEYEYHMKIVELLEELKKRRNADEGYLADIYQDIGYKNGIDDFAKLVKEHNWNIRNRNENEFIYGAIDRLAEQLKVGGAE